MQSILQPTFADTFCECTGWSVTGVVEANTVVVILREKTNGKYGIRFLRTTFRS